MRTMNKNKNLLWYALYEGKEPIYDLDSDGNKKISFIDETSDPPTEYYKIKGYKDETYSKPVRFLGNIRLSGGDSQEVEFGVSESQYEAVLITPRNLLPITETSLIWYQTEPKTTDGHADKSSADYKIIKVSKAMDKSGTDKYILAKVVK